MIIVAIGAAVEVTVTGLSIIVGGPGMENYVRRVADFPKRLFPPSANGTR